MQIKAIGYVRSPFASPEECPRQGRQDMPPCIIDMEQEFVPGLHRLVPGQKIVVLTWMHMARRDLFRCRPRNSPARPIHGVFATRSPNRPNPIGLHEVRILEISRNRLKVHPLEAVDRTPVLDIKPVLGSPGFSGQIRDFFSLEDMNALMEAARQGWLRGLFSGVNGNLSLRRGNTVLITRSGTSKACLTPDDFCVLELTTGKLLAGSDPSIESRMHLSVYSSQEKAGAVVHTHPAHVLALSQASSDNLFRQLDLFEARVLHSQVGMVRAMEPGSDQLASAVGRLARESKCIIMLGHGLTCWDSGPFEALASSEELDSLALMEIHLRLLNVQNSQI